jgi:hypothetical protein
MPLGVGAALLASADGYTPRANAALDKAREESGTIPEIATALADNLPAPKLTARKSRRRRRKKKAPQAAVEAKTPEAVDGKPRKNETSEAEPEAEAAEPVPLVPERAPDEPEPAEDAA